MNAMRVPIVALLVLALVPATPAQTKPEPAADEPVSLTAFTVSTSRDVGYTATNTLAGTRLNTPLSDVGTAVSVVTKEFLTDVAANDASTLLTYTVSTEIGGIE